MHHGRENCSVKAGGPSADKKTASCNGLRRAVLVAQGCVRPAKSPCRPSPKALSPILMVFPQRVTRYLLVCFAYASLYHFSWAALNRENLEQCITRHTFRGMLYLLGTTVTFFLLVLFILALTCSGISKRPLPDIAIFNSVLVVCFVLGGWAWGAVDF